MDLDRIADRDSLEDWSSIRHIDQIACAIKIHEHCLVRARKEHRTQDRTGVVAQGSEQPGYRRTDFVAHTAARRALPAREQGILVDCGHTRTGVFGVTHE